MSKGQKQTETITETQTLMKSVDAEEKLSEKETARVDLELQATSGPVIPIQKESGWTLVFLIAMTLGVIIFGFGLKSIVGYTLNRKNISTQTLTPEQVEELYSELRSAVLLLIIGILLLVMMLFTAYKSIMSFF